MESTWVISHLHLPQLPPTPPPLQLLLVVCGITRNCSVFLALLLGKSPLPALSFSNGGQQRTTHSNDSNDDLYYVCVRRYLSKSPFLPHQPTTDKPPNSERARSAEKSSGTHHRLLNSSASEEEWSEKTSYAGTNVHQRQKRRRTRTWMIIRTYYSNKQVSDIL